MEKAITTSEITAESEIIEDSRIDEISIGTIISKNKTFTIPYQQRGYRWRVRNLLELLSDLIEFVIHPTSKKYCLQPLAVSEKDSICKVWDGQQRLTTLYLLFKALGIDEPYTFIFERDKENDRAAFIKNPFLDVENKNSIDLFYIGRAYQVFKDCINNNTDSTLINRSDKTESALFNNICSKLQESELKQNIIKLLTNRIADKQLIFLWYVVPETVATEIFRDINSGKISLTNSELIKAILLSEQSDIPNRELTAAQFAEIESVMLDDHFWYMIQSYETKLRSNVAQKEIILKNGLIDMKNRLLRMDLLFNLVAGVSYDRYLKDPIASFRYFYDNRSNIESKWNDVRQKYQIIKAIYENIESYHYVGFLSFCSRSVKVEDTYKMISEIISLYTKSSRSKFIAVLKNKVRDNLNVASGKLADLDFNKNKEAIRRVLLLHNISTLLDIYHKQQSNGQLHLDRPFELFPYELLYRQTWHIEHISPATNNPLKKEKDQMEWIESTKSDFYDLFPDSDNNQKKSRFSKSEIESVSEKLTSYFNSTKDKKEEKFNELYDEIIRIVEGLSGSDMLKDKYCLGNYVLLDETTNTSFQNSLFPTKRRIIIAASGQKVPILDHEIKLVYLPPCTKAAFMKFYSTYPSMSLTDWNQKDADAYEKDIKDKIKDFLK